MIIFQRHDNDFIGAIIYEELGIFGLALMIIPTAIEDTQTPACLSTICPDFYAQGGIIFYIFGIRKSVFQTRG